MPGPRIALYRPNSSVGVRIHSGIIYRPMRMNPRIIWMPNHASNPNGAPREVTKMVTKSPMIPVMNRNQPNPRRDPPPTDGVGAMYCVVVGINVTIVKAPKFDLHLLVKQRNAHGQFI